MIDPQEAASGTELPAEIEAALVAYEQAIRDTERAYNNREAGRKYVVESEREDRAALAAAITKSNEAHYNRGLRDAMGLR